MKLTKLYWKKIMLPCRLRGMQLSLVSLVFFGLLWMKLSAEKTFLSVEYTLFQKVSAGAPGAVNTLVQSSGQDPVSNQYLLSLLPVPQQVSLSAQTFLFNNNWSVEGNISENNSAVQSLIEGLNEQKIKIKIQAHNAAKLNSSQTIKLTVKDGAVLIGPTTDTNRIALKMQAYRLKLNAKEISITANAPQGLYYGVQTLLQLIKSQKEKALLPEGEIVDWPDMNVRMIYWDDAHHLEKMEALRRTIRQAAYFKINAFALKLEGHFQYESAKPIVEPYALTPAEYQELTDYAKERYVELVPYLDAPAHVSFILKHPEYAHLRAFPNSNYEFSVTNPETDTLLLRMFGELIDANRGGKYILLSTDEAYYVGKAEDDKKQAEALGGKGKLFAQFTSRIANELHKRGRTVIFWGEYPLTPSDISALPSHLVNGVYDSKWAPAFKEHKMRQFIYTYTQGEELLFPSYYPMSSGDTALDAAKDRATGRVEGMLKTISSAVAEQKSDFMGVIVAGWADAGLHPETFWLGYATGAAAGWNHHSVTADGLTSRFYRSFYGPSAVEMDKVYRLLSRQAQFYEQSWDWIASDLRKPILGNSYDIFDKPQPAKDQSLPMLPVPSANDLTLTYDWDTANVQRLKLAKQFLKENDELQDLLKRNIKGQDYKQYNLEVLTSVAMICRQNIEMLIELKRINILLKAASASASVNAARAVLIIDSALDMAATIKSQRDKMLTSVTQVWYKDWHPLVQEANGRRFLLEVDDIKDHQPGRTIDLSYLIYRQLHYPLGKWAEEVKKIRNEYAGKNHMPLRKAQLQWEDIN